MPVIKLFTDEKPPAAAAAALATDIETLCTTVLDARSDAVQVVLQAGAAMLRGAPLLAEVHYRARADRDTAALARFMEGLDASCRRHLGLAPRIRCFAVDQATLYARN